MHRGEETALWFWPVQGGAPRRVGDVMAKEAVWSPTGDMIAFVRGETILITDTQGSDCAGSGAIQTGAHSLLWSPDGKRLRFTQSNLVEGTDSMWEIGIDGKSLRRVLPGEEGGPHEGSGTWLAGGKLLCVFDGSGLARESGCGYPGQLVAVGRKTRVVWFAQRRPDSIDEGADGVVIIRLRRQAGHACLRSDRTMSTSFCGSTPKH